MEAIDNFKKMERLLLRRDVRKRVGIVWAADAATREAVGMALEKGFVEAVFIGCRHEAMADSALSPYGKRISFVDADDADQAAAIAAKMAKNKEIDIIMKGMLNTDNLLRAFLNKETGILPKGSVLTHITAAQIPSYKKLLLFTDAAVIPYPTDAQRLVQVRLVASMARSLGVECPKIALIHCSEKPNPRHFPFTEDYIRLREMAQRGELGKCIVDGPLDVKTACNRAAMEKKQIHSPINGEADALVFPDIDSANVFYKTITLFGGASTAGLLVGLDVPVVLPSRGDSPASKLCSLELASL